MMRFILSKNILVVVLTAFLQMGLSACKPSTPMENNMNAVELQKGDDQTEKSSFKTGIKIMKKKKNKSAHKVKAME